MAKTRCPLKIILANAVREVKCLYRRSLRLCPEDPSQCLIYSIHRKNSLDMGRLVDKTDESAVIPQLKPYKEPANIPETQEYKPEEQRTLEERASQSGLNVDDLRMAYQDIVLPEVKPEEGDGEEDRRYTL